jgi:hypothetical protein
MKFFSVFVLYLCAICFANADVLTQKPYEVCDVLDKVGLSTRGDWKKEYDQEYGCSSSYKQIGSGRPLANNLAYYVEGNSTTVRDAYLMLNINDKPSAGNAHKELVKAAQLLSKEIAGKELTKPLVLALTKGANASEKVGNTMVEITKNTWPTGRGYDVKILFR